jgi:hypothetical protein
VPGASLSPPVSASAARHGGGGNFETRDDHLTRDLPETIHPVHDIQPVKNQVPASAKRVRDGISPFCDGREHFTGYCQNPTTLSPNQPPLPASSPLISESSNTVRYCKMSSQLHSIPNGAQSLDKKTVQEGQESVGRITRVCHQTVPKMENYSQHNTNSSGVIYRLLITSITAIHQVAK